MNSNHCIRILSLALLACLAQFSRADIIMVVDTTAKSITFSGSDTGTVNFSDAVWQLTGVGGTGDSSTFQDTGLALASPTSTDLTVTSNTVSGGFLEVRVSDTDGTRTLTGSGSPISYLSWSAGAQARLEGAIGGPSIPAVSAGFQPIAITSAVVPESSAFLTSLLLGCAVCLRRRRRRPSPVS